MVKVQVMRTSFSCTFSPPFGALATCSDISMLLLAVAYVTGPECSGQPCRATYEGVVNRLGDKHILLPHDLTPDLAIQNFGVNSCIGCYYRAEFLGVKSRSRITTPQNNSRLNLNRFAGTVAH